MKTRNFFLFFALLLSAALVFSTGCKEESSDKEEEEEEEVITTPPEDKDEEEVSTTLPDNLLGKWQPTKESFAKIMEGEGIPAEAIEELAKGSTVEITGEKIIFLQEFQGEKNEDSKPYRVVSSTSEKTVLEISEPDGSKSISTVSRSGDTLTIKDGEDTIVFTKKK